MNNINDNQPPENSPTPADNRRDITTGGGVYNEGQINNTGGLNVLGGETGPITYTDQRGATINNLIGNDHRRICPSPPNPADNFTGRNQPLADLTAKLKAGTKKIIAVQGLDGLGKTTLAQQLAHQLYFDKTFRAVLWVDFGSNPDQLRLLVNWIKYAAPDFIVGEREEVDLKALAQRVKAMLEELLGEKCIQCDSQRTLVVLDDVWPLAVPGAKLLHSACPVEATILLTTRSREVASQLDVLDIYPLPALTNQEGAELLEKYLPGLDPALLLQLVETLGGHPLALLLAIRRLQKVYTSKAGALRKQLAEYQSGLLAGKSFQDMKLDSGAGGEGNLTMVLSYSYEELTSEDKARFRALGILPANQSFDLAILAGLWGVEEETAGEYAGILCQSSLIEVTSEADEGWFKQHQLLHSQALFLLQAAPEEYQQAQRRYHEFVMELASHFSRKEAEQTNQLALYLSHLEFVWNELMSEATQIRGQFELVKKLAHFVNKLGSFYAATGDKEKALQAYNQTLELSRELQDQLGEGRTHNYLGRIYFNLRKNQEALQHYEQALAIQEAIADTEGLALTLTNLGRYYSQIADGTQGTPKDREQALTYFQRSLKLWQQVGDKSGEANTFTNLGWVYLKQLKRAEALQQYESALALQQQINDRRGESVTLNNLGDFYFQSGEWQQALNFYNRALPIRQEIHDRWGEANTLASLAKTYQALGQLGNAIDWLVQAIKVEEVSGHYNLANDRRLLDQWHNELNTTN